ncbi:MAG TPA: Hsp70 family protein [Mycobacterium sp.]|nr:Hsp70 family protein [Mycobacterium sp.]
MSDPQGGKGNSLGLAIGATYLAGAGNGQRPVVRRAAVTLDRGLVLSGFVDRVGDPIPMVAQDGSRHRPEILLVEALDALARSAANGAPVSEVAVTVPAHWRPQVVETMRAALRSKPGLRRSPLVSDATAALTALRSDPGLPSSGVIVLCDFGGSGTSITLVDAAKDAPIGETVRVPDFSGDHIDQAILTKVVAEIFEATDADPSGTAMVGSLARLRDECRRAKERLSDETATGIVVDLPGLETTVRMTRMELDDLIDGQLSEFVAVLVDTLDRHRVSLASISAVATVGGGARIPLITQRLSEHLRSTVITTAVPQLTAAAGVALIAQRSQIVESATALAPAAPATATVAAAAVGIDGPPTAVGALAWSEVEDDLGDALEDETHFGNPYAAAPGDSRPELEFTHEVWEDQPSTRRRSPVVLFGLAAAAVVIGAVVFGLTALSRDTSPVPAGTSSSIASSPASAPAPDASAPAAEAPAQAPAPEQTTVVSRPQPQVVPQQPAAVDVAPQPAAAPAPEAPAQAPAPAPEAPAPAPEPAPAPAPAPWTPPWNPPWRQPTESGTGGTGAGTGSTGNGTGTGTSTGSGGTGTGSSGSGTGTGTGAGGGGSSAGTGTGAADSGGAKTPAGPGLVAPILQPILTPQP